MTNPTTRHARPLLTAFGALALLLTSACSGDDDSDEARSTTTAPATATTTGAADDTGAQAYVDAAAASLTSDPELAMDQETATCIATAFVDVIGADDLAQAGVSPEEFAADETFDVPPAATTQEAATRLSETLDDCDVAGSLTPAFASSLGVDLPPEALTCLDEHVDHQTVNDAFADSLLAPSEDALDEAGASLEDTVEATLLDATVACPQVVTALFFADAPADVTPETQACVSALIEAEPELVRGAIGGDSAAADELGTRIGETCADTLGS
jgi:hypothetical protein